MLPDPAPLPAADPASASIAQVQGRAPLGAPVQITHDGGDGLQFAIIPLPTYQTPRNTLEQRLTAIANSYAGRITEAVDLYRATVREDGFFDGILRTMAHGILGLPVSFSQGSPEQCSALLNADGTAGDFAAMHPQEECAEILMDGLCILGLGQYLLMCWQCGCTENTIERPGKAQDEPPDVPAPTFEVCKRCSTRRVDRPLGVRELFQLQWRDPRWLDQETLTGRWYYTCRQGRVEVIDGDGEWFIFRTVPGLEPWRHGLWRWATLAAIFARDAAYDAQNTSAVCAPTPVLRALKPVHESTRAEAEQRMRTLGFDNRLVLNGEWLYEIIAAKAEFIDITGKIVDRSSDAFETGLTGNVMGRAAKAAFTDAGIYKRTTSERRSFYAGAWFRQIREKGLVHWGVDNYGTRNVPVPECDVRSPEDKLASAKGVAETGNAIKALTEACAVAGMRPTTTWVTEFMQQAGIRVEPLAAPTPPAGQRPPPAPTTSQAPPPTAPVADDEEPQEPDDAARLAEKLSSKKIERCYHGFTRCRRCGVERVYDVEVGPDGQPVWPILWKAFVVPKVAV